MQRLTVATNYLKKRVLKNFGLKKSPLDGIILIFLYASILLV